MTAVNMKPDVFISYTREDETTAKLLAERLGASGLDVWWDRKLFPGCDFDREIEKMIENARAVVVLWSQQAVLSRWVRAEASEALAQHKLIPIQIKNCKVPLEFRRLQTVKLLEWDGNAEHVNFCEVLQALMSFKAGAAPSSPPVQGITNGNPASWAIQSSKVRWFGADIVISRQGVVHLVEYKNKGSHETVALDGKEICRGGGWMSAHSFFQVFLPHRSGVSVCIIEPVYGLMAKLLTMQLSGVRVNIDGELLANI